MDSQWNKILINQLHRKLRYNSQLGNCVELVPGYFPTESRTFKLEKCETKNHNTIEGFSKLLGRRVVVEKKATRPLIYLSKLSNYGDTRFSQCDARLVLNFEVEHRSLFSDRAYRIMYPLTARYLDECKNFLGENKGLSLNKVLMSARQIASIDRKKIILAISPDRSVAVADEKEYVVNPLHSYNVGFQKGSEDLFYFYQALFNSKMFSFLCLNALDTNERMLERLYSIPMPAIHFAEENLNVIQNLVEMISYVKNGQYSLNSLVNASNEKSRAEVLLDILDMVIYELYFPEYMREKRLNVLDALRIPIESVQNVDKRTQVDALYKWYQKPKNEVRESVELLDVRSRDFLYGIHQYRLYL